MAGGFPVKKKRARGELLVRERERKKGKEQGEEGRRARPGSVVVVAVGVWYSGKAALVDRGARGRASRGGDRWI